MTPRSILWSLALLTSALWLGPSGTAHAQEPGPAPAAGGPTRDARAATARTHLASEVSPAVMPRYQAFQRNFTRDFGTLQPRVSDRLDAWLGLQTRLEERWGDTALYQWIERGFALYARIEASTRTERKGFDIEVEANDVAQGKLGVRMTRPLGAASTE